MEKSDTVEKVDFIFFLLKDEQKYLTVDQFVVRSLTRKNYIKKEKIIIILDFLHEEKLIDKEPLSQGKFHYRINVRGLLFNGYYNQSIKDDLSERRILLNTKWLTIGTCLAALLGLLLLLWQVFLYFYPIHKDYPLFFWQK